MSCDWKVDHEPRQVFEDFGERVSDAAAAEVYARVGGRLTFLNRVARAREMLAACDAIKEAEKTWFLNQCWILGSEMDDDVMDQQKWAVRTNPLPETGRIT